MIINHEIGRAMSISLEDIFPELPEKKPFIEGIRRASKREFQLSLADTELALKNALRYVPEKWHDTLAPEYLEELMTTGRIYAYRFRPDGPIKGNPIEAGPGDPAFPQEIQEEDLQFLVQGFQILEVQRERYLLSSSALLPEQNFLDELLRSEMAAGEA